MSNSINPFSLVLVLVCWTLDHTSHGKCYAVCSPSFHQLSFPKLLLSDTPVTGTCPGVGPALHLTMHLATFHSFSWHYAWLIYESYCFWRSSLWNDAFSWCHLAAFCRLRRCFLLVHVHLLKVASIVIICQVSIVV